MALSRDCDHAEFVSLSISWEVFAIRVVTSTICSSSYNFSIRVGHRRATAMRMLCSSAHDLGFLSKFAIPRSAHRCSAHTTAAVKSTGLIDFGTMYASIRLLAQADGRASRDRSEERELTGVVGGDQNGSDLSITVHFIPEDAYLDPSSREGS